MAKKARAGAGKGAAKAMEAKGNAPREALPVLEALARIRVRQAAPEESDLHAAVAEAFAAAGIEARHEAALGPRRRVDFLCGTVGVEIKKGPVPPARLCEQCARYLASPLLTALVVVSPRALRVPARIGGKPVVVFSLNRLWGVALP